MGLCPGWCELQGTRHLSLGPSRPPRDGPLLRGGTVVDSPADTYCRGSFRGIRFPLLTTGFWRIGVSPVLGLAELTQQYTNELLVDGVERPRPVGENPTRDYGFSWAL